MANIRRTSNRRKRIRMRSYLNLAVILLLRSGGVRVQAGDLTQGQIIALYNYLSQILVELIKFANLILTVTKAIASGNRVQELLELNTSMEDGTVEMKNTAMGCFLTL